MEALLEVLTIHYNSICDVTGIYHATFASTPDAVLEELEFVLRWITLASKLLSLQCSKAIACQITFVSYFDMIFVEITYDAAL
jgi:hypothetical protein